VDGSQDKHQEFQNILGLTDEAEKTVIPQLPMPQ
jgi:hypothetical protein